MISERFTGWKSVKSVRHTQFISCTEQTQKHGTPLTRNQQINKVSKKYAAEKYHLEPLPPPSSWAATDRHKFVKAILLPGSCRGLSLNTKQARLSGPQAPQSTVPYIPMSCTPVSPMSYYTILNHTITMSYHTIPKHIINMPYHNHAIPKHTILVAAVALCVHDVLSTVFQK